MTSAVSESFPGNLFGDVEGKKNHKPGNKASECLLS